AATQFVTPLTFQSLTHRPVLTNLFDPRSELSIDHVAAARSADALVIAPATANVIAKLACGLADDPVTTTALATTAPIVVCPAMEHHMYCHPATQANLELLKSRGVTVVEPEEGRLASGQRGKGRLADIDVIVSAIRWVLGRRGDLAGRRPGVTAGGTREALDPGPWRPHRARGQRGNARAGGGA